MPALVTPRPPLRTLNLDDLAPTSRIRVATLATRTPRFVPSRPDRRIRYHVRRLCCRYDGPPSPGARLVRPDVEFVFFCDGDQTFRFVSPRCPEGGLGACVSQKKSAERATSRRPGTAAMAKPSSQVARETVLAKANHAVKNLKDIKVWACHLPPVNQRRL